MALPAGSSSFSIIKWSDQPVTLKDMSSKCPVPNLIRITKGQYRTIGVAKNVHSELYLHSINNSKKVMAQSVKVKKDGKRAVISNQKYSLPITYQGWFEVMSADGKAIRAIQNIQELVRMYPHQCLVRENIKGYINRETGDVVLDRMRVVHTGEQLTLVGEMFLPVGTGKNLMKRRLLRCLDEAGESVYFGLEQKGLFSPMAGHNNISGVHNIRGLFDKFRLPIMVRLVHGIIPTKLEKSFNGVFRLTSIYSDETAYVIPLKKETKMLPISTREPLKVAVADNFEELKDSEECRNHQQRCNQMIVNYQNSIHLLYSMPDPDAIAAAKEEMKRLKIGPGADQQSVVSHVTALPRVEEDYLFDEVEDIYRYVREGGEPPAPRPRPQPPQPAAASVASSKTRANGKKSIFRIFSGTKEKNTGKDEPPAPQEDSPETSHHLSETQVIPMVNADPHHKEKDLDQTYWEEPIYEPLGKIRQKKQDDAEMLAITDEQKRAILDHPVDNLRQVLKQQTSQIDSGHHSKSNTPSVLAASPVSSITDDPFQTSGTTRGPEQLFLQDPDADDPEDDEEDIPPPVPPKQFYFGEEEGRVIATDFALPDSDYMIPPAPKLVTLGQPSIPVTSAITGHSHSQFHPNGTAIATVTANDAAIATATALTSHAGSSPRRSTSVDSNHHILAHSRINPARKGRNRISLNKSSPFVHRPPYVAVAHVGEHNGSGSPPVARKAMNSSSRGKIQKVYL